MTGTTIGDVVPAMVSTFATALPDLQVVDGPDYDARVSFLAVGWAGENQPAISVTRTISDAGRSRDEEDYDVDCVLSCHLGGGTVRTVRDQMLSIFETAASALRADTTLGGFVTRAWVTGYELVPVLAETGATATLRFTVNVKAWK